MGRKKYNTEEERKAARKEYMKEYNEANKEHINERKKEYYKEYYKTKKEHRKKYMKEYDKTPMGRASNLISRYKQSDKKYNRGKCTLTPQWIVDNIFSKPCIYCGVEGWDIIGCDRIDNDKPHTPDNVVPCCGECNKKRGTKPFEEFLKEMQQKMLEEFENPL